MVSLAAKGIVDKTEEKESVVDRIEKTLASKGSSKSWLADKLGVSRQSLNFTLKHGKNLKSLPEIADALQVSLIWLETGNHPQTVVDKKTRNLIKVYDLGSLTVEESSKIPLFEIPALEKDAEINIAIQLFNYPDMDEWIPENAILIFKKTSHCQDNDIVLLINKGQPFVRKCNVKNDIMYFIGSGKEVDDMTTNNSIRIIGVLDEMRVKF